MAIPIYTVLPYCVIDVVIFSIICVKHLFSLMMVARWLPKRWQNNVVILSMASVTDENKNK